MTSEEQKAFLIDMLKGMIRDLITYRAFCEKARADLGLPGRQQIDEYLNLDRNEPSVKSQLGPDFEAFVLSALQGEKRHAGLVLDAFLREWTPRRDPN